jgi:formylmethanofuran dehydrogenase subunit E-like metal-binding protein
MRTHAIQRLLSILVLLAFAAAGCAAKFGAQPTTPTMRKAQKALDEAMAALDVDAQTPGVLLITNAGYGAADGRSSEAYFDLAMQTVGRTPGTRSLLAVVTPANEPLWFALYRAATGKVAFLVLTDGGFTQQIADLSPSVILTPDGWADAANGPLKQRLFSVASISLSWAAGASWPMLKAAELHDHFCPGLNAGFIVLELLKEELPLADGDSYTFVGAPPFCAMDAFQILEGKTLGKKGSLGLANQLGAGAGFAVGGVQPSLIVLRTNRKKNACDALVLGIDWSKIQTASNVGPDDMNPPGGHANPLFYVSRAKMSWVLAQMTMQDKLDCIVVLKRASGTMELATAVASGAADPYRALP